MHSFHIHPINLIKALSMALELAINGLSRHHWRTAVICKELGSALALSNQDQQRLVYAALLHDIGAASNWNERQQLKAFDAAIPSMVYRHAEAGYLLLKDSARLADLAEPVRYHHDRWLGGNPSGLEKKEIPLLGQIIHVADRVEVLIHEEEPIFAQKIKIITRIKEKSGVDFDPAIVEALERVAKRESFWLDLMNLNYYETFFRGIDFYGAIRYSLEDALRIAEIFATIIDRTSTFTATHSRSVAKIAVFVAGLKGFSQDELKSMEIAGLLHDLGKLAIPNEILEKPGPLSKEEVVMIRQHTYYTYRILEQIDNFEVIAQWAAYHHETLDGLGYPFRVAASSLSLGSRIVAVADVFVALTEDRPYRVGLPEATVKRIMDGMVANHKLDGGVVESLFVHYSEANAMMKKIVC